MPFYLKDLDVVPKVAEFQSVLIVPCRFCPAASMAVRKNEPWIELFRRFLRTAPYERLIKTIQSRLEEKGVKTKVFESNLPYQFIACLWPSGQRKKLSEHAKQYDAVIVMGCEAATEAV